MGAVEDDASAGSDADDEPEPNTRVVGGEQGEGDEQPAQHEPGGPGAEVIADEEGGPTGLSLAKLEFDGPSGRSTHEAGPQADGGSCTLELSLGKMSGAVSLTVTTTYHKPSQPEPEPPPGGADAGQPPPAKRKAKPKKEEEDRDRALQCRFGVAGVLQVVQLTNGLAVDDRARDTRFHGLHHWRCEPSNQLALEELLQQMRGRVAAAAAKKLGLSSAAQKAAQKAAAAALPTVSFEEAVELGAAAGQACTAEAATGGANAMDVEEPGAEEPGAAAAAPAGPPYVCACCFKSLQSLSKIKSHIIRGRTGVACVMGAELGNAACRKSTGPSGGAAPVAERAALPDFAAYSLPSF